VDGINRHPDARDPGEVLKRQFGRGDLARMSPADLVSAAMAQELKNGLSQDQLSKAEREKDYPGTAKHGRVISADTRIVMVDGRLAERLKAGEGLSFQEILAGSVQVWAQKIEKLGLRAVDGRHELYEWPHEYDNFLGYMAGVLKMSAFLVAGGEVI
jgi:CRISPR-associated endonuclease/helicase Cas3